MHRPIVVTLLALLATPATVRAQGTLEVELAPGDYVSPLIAEGLDELLHAPSLRWCEPPRRPIGYLDARGLLYYRVLASGRMDTASVQVIETDGATAPGLRSAAIRYLAGCHFRAAQTTAGKVPALVRQHLNFTGARRQATFIPPPDPVPDHPDTSDSTLYDVFAPSLDELPRPLACTFGSHNPGDILLGFVVDTLGRAEALSVQVLQTDAPHLSAAALRIATACVYAPGRVRGNTVRVRVAQRYVFH
jgi:hypothetical protein